jgi:capsular exopolysaccharide synthesis family protein
LKTVTKGNPATMVVTHHDPKALAAEAFRVLRTNLQFMGLDAPLRSLAVTSATPGEGKSTISANLAVAFAQTGASVCVVDADLRRPTQHKLFGLDNWAGVTTVVAGQSPLEGCLRETAVEGLHVLPSGPVPPNPSELLGSRRMAALLAELEERFDVVIVDTPPVLAVTDACVLAPKVGGMLLVARSGQVDRRQVDRAKVALEAVQAKVLGVVLDGLAQESKQGYYYYYGSQTEERAHRK